MSVLDLFRLDGKVALITGGGRGLGAQIAQAYAEAGAKVVLCSRRVENCEALAKAIVAGGGEALALALDVTSPESVQAVVDETVKVYGRIDILVNNGGASWGAPALEMPYDAWQKVVQTNLTGTFLMSQAVGRYMEQQGGGKIINIASAAGFRGTPPECPGRSRLQRKQGWNHLADERSRRQMGASWDLCQRDCAWFLPNQDDKRCSGRSRQRHHAGNSTGACRGRVRFAGCGALFCFCCL